MATVACAKDDVRFAVGEAACPQCGSTDAFEAGSPEHEAALAERAKPAPKKSARADETAKPE